MSLISDECGRQLLGLILKQNRNLGAALGNYLVLFKPATRDLSNSRALAIAEDTLALHSNQDILRVALIQAVAAANKKQDSGEWKQPKAGREHGWLKVFIESTEGEMNKPKPIKPPLAEQKPDLPRRAAPPRDGRTGKPVTLKQLMVMASQNLQKP
jgi:hypothetical protein